jgi:hypothetical protein
MKLATDWPALEETVLEVAAEMGALEAAAAQPADPEAELLLEIGRQARRELDRRRARPHDLAARNLSLPIERAANLVLAPFGELCLRFKELYENRDLPHGALLYSRLAIAACEELERRERRRHLH